VAFNNMVNLMHSLSIRMIFRHGITLLCLVSFQLYSNDSAQSNLFSQAIAMTDTLKIGLHDAILIGLENNAAVTIQRLEPEVMGTFTEEQRAAFDPVIGADGQKSNSKSQRRLGSQVKPFDLLDERFDVTVDVSETLPTGTSLSIYTGMTGSVSNLYTDQYTGSLGLTITQSLLQGVGFGANLANLRKARLDVDITKSELKAVAEQITAEIEKSYWDLYLTGQEMSIQQQSLELALQQRFESLERIKVGKLPELELAAVDAEVAVRRSALIEAQSRNQQTRLQFLYLLNPSKESIWYTYPLPVDKPFLPTDTLDSIAVHEEMGMKYRPDLQQARLELEKGALEVKRTKNGLLPQLDFFISLGKTTYAETFKDALPTFSGPFYQVNTGLLFGFPVPNRKASAQLKRAQSSLEQQTTAVKNMEKLVQRDIHSAYIEVVRARQQIEAIRVARELQGKKLDAELEKFRVGKSTNFLVLQAQRDFTTSQLDDARSLVAYLLALVDLYRSEGTLLERRGIHTVGD
jgi:outer membrane protein